MGTVSPERFCEYNCIMDKFDSIQILAIGEGKLGTELQSGVGLMFFISLVKP